MPVRCPFLADMMAQVLSKPGIMACPADTTAEGYEIQFGTNHIGHALFTKLLTPTMQNTAEQQGSDVRIINLTSMGHQLAPSGGIVFDSLKSKQENINTWQRYGLWCRTSSRP